MKTTWMVLTVAGVLMGAGLNEAVAQERPAAGAGQGRGGGQGMARMNPLFATLDANSDGVIDATELGNAAAALKKLDKNSDGKLTVEEVRPTPGGPGGPGAQGAPGGRGGGAAAVDPAERVARMMEFDTNKDGKLSKEELPERMARMFERGDADGDGLLSKAELEKMGPPAGGGAGRQGRPTSPPPAQ